MGWPRSQDGALTVGALRLLGLALVTALYFRRSGQLAQAWADLRGVRLLLAERKPWQEESSSVRRRLFLLLRWALRVKE